VIILEILLNIHMYFCYVVIAKEREFAHAGRGGKEAKIVKKLVLQLVQSRINDAYSDKNKS
jgi:hypothetical protein